MAGFLRFALPLIALLSIFPLYTRYKAAAAPISRRACTWPAWS